MNLQPRSRRRLDHRRGNQGSEHRDERVIIGGHLDSWDLAVDNGTGAMAVLEAARTLKALGRQLNRTITFILYTGEEEGGVGVRLFLKSHAAEIPQIDAVLTHDIGTGRVFSPKASTKPRLCSPKSISRFRKSSIFSPPAPAISALSITPPTFVPELPPNFCVQAPAGYREAHHSQTDNIR